MKVQMNKHFQEVLRQATRLTHQGHLGEATQLIQSALAIRHPASNTMKHPTAPRIFDSGGIEVVVPPESAHQPSEGSFLTGSHGNATHKRDYKLYIPPNHEGANRPLVVMLHGCTQDSSDFATGTGMNERARQQGFFVLYPEQSSRANPSRCWNWFKHNHQRRGSGEPELIADMTRAIIKRFDIDPARIYVAGLSAGGAMAAILAEAYPDLFAAAGIHSGLAPRAAQNVSEALAAMKGGASASSSALNPEPGRTRPIATIVFHGDRDSTVHPDNGEQVIRAALATSSTGAEAGNASRSRSKIETGQSGSGRDYTRTIHFDNRSEACAEHWLIHGAGHAWSGGQKEGTFTDPAGPGATDEMLRFFREQSTRRPS